MRRILLILITGILAAAPLCAEDSMTVRAATLKGPSGFGMIRLFEEAPELGENVETKFQVLPTPQEMVARVAGGELDFAVFPSNMAAKLYTAGPGYRLGAITGLGVLSVVSSDSSIDSWGDLEGRRIRSIGKGATPDFLTRYLLSENGLDPEDDVELDFSVKSAPQLAQLLIAGKAETAVLPQPFVTMVELKSKGKVSPVLDFQEEWKRVRNTETSYPITVVVVKPSLAEDRPRLVADFLDAYERSIEWVNANPAEAAELIGKYEVLPAQLAKPAIPHCNLRFIPAQQAKPIMEDYLGVLLDFNPSSVGGSLPDEGFYFAQ
jgi:NitT/TauT family transport system substrate-binding protein